MSRVLLIDDAPDVRALVRVVLEMAGHDVREMAGPADVVAAASEFGADAVIMDLMMPDLAGWDAFVTLRHTSRTAHLPILLVSGGPMPLPVTDAELGHWQARYLAKPFGVRDLLDALDDLLALGAPLTRRVAS